MIDTTRRREPWLDATARKHLSTLGTLVLMGALSILAGTLLLLDLGVSW